jgi:PAS domain S-box-containing protein
MDYDSKIKSKSTAELSQANDQIANQKTTDFEQTLSFESLRTILDGINSLVYVVDMETQEILFINDYGRRIWGDITGDICWQTLQKDMNGPCSFCTNDKVVDSNGKPTGIYTWEKQNSVDNRWYECRDQAILWPDGRIVKLEISTDITHQKNAEEKNLAYISFLKNLEKIDRVLVNATNLNKMMKSTLETVLSIYESDRSFLIYPCNPESPSYKIPMECTQPEYPGALELSLEVPMDSAYANIFRLALSSDNPIEVGPSGEYPVSQYFEDELDVQSQLVMAIKPRIGEPWLFGMHQCSNARNWTEHEHKLFREVGCRIGDALSSLSFHRDLREKDERYRAIYEQSIDAYMIVDPEIGFVSGNEATIKLYGCFDEEEFINQSPAALSPEYQPDGSLSSEKADSMMILAMENGSNYFEWKHKKLDGTLFDATVLLTRMQINDRTVLQGTVRDITKQKEVEQKFKVKDFIISSASSAIATASLEGIMTYVNPAFLMVWGFDSPEDVLGRPIADFWIVNDRIDEIFNALLGNEKKWSSELKAKRKDETIFDVYVFAATVADETGTPIGLMSTSVDITDLKKVEEAFQRSEEQLRNMIEQAPYPIQVFNIYGDTVQVNKAWEILWDTSWEKMQELGGYNVINDEQQMERGLNDYIKRAFSGEYVEVPETEYVVSRPGKNAKVRRFVSSRICPIKDKNGIIENVLMMQEDTTKRKQAEEKNQAHIKFLRCMEKIDRVLVNATDLNQMMNGVLETILSIFESDRSWLLYPCDPDAPTFVIPMEFTRPEYPGAKELNVVVPMDPGSAEVCRLALLQDTPVEMGPSGSPPVPKALKEQFSIKSQLVIAIHPRIGSSWLFGMHQCSHSRRWLEEERKLFREIARRTNDALSSLLFLKDLRERDERYRAIYEQSVDVFMILDPEKGYISGNEAAIKLFGCVDEEEFIKHNPASLSPEYQPDGTLSTEKAAQLINKTMETGLSYFEWKHKRMDGTPFDAKILLSKLIINDKHLFQGTIHDITERKEAEKALEDNKVKLESIFKAAPVGIGLISDNVLREVNDQICHMIGYSREDLLGNNYRLLFPDNEEYDSVGNIDSDHIKNKSIDSIESKWKCKDGKIIDVLLSMVPIYSDGLSIEVTFTALDITDRNEAQQAIQASHERYQGLADATFEAIFILEDGFCVSANKSACKMFGYDENELIGIFATDIIAPESHEIVKNNISSEYEKPYEAVATKKDGTKFHVEIRGLMKRFMGKVVRITVIRDIDERIRTLEKISKNEAFLKSIFLTAPTGIAVVENRELTIVNDRFSEISGYSRKELIGNSTRMLYTSEEEYERIGKELYRDIIEKGQSTLEASILHKSGNEIFVLITSAPLRSLDEGNAITLTILDITSQKQAEEDLRKHQEHLEEVVSERTEKLVKVNKRLEHEVVSRKEIEEIIKKQNYDLKTAQSIAHIGSWHLDIKSEKLTWSSELYRIMDIDPESGTDIKEFMTIAIHPSDQKEVTTKINTILKDGEKQEYEYRITLFNGAERIIWRTLKAFYDENGEIFRIAGIDQDITERKNAELTLLETQERFSSIVQSSPMGVFLYEIRENDDLILIDVNQAADDITGTANRGKIGMTIEEAFPPLEATEIPDRYRDAAKNGISWQTESVAYKDEEIAGAFKVFAFQTSPKRMAVMFQDVTDQKKTQVALQKAKDAAEKANMAKSEFLANMSHEIRTPLNAVTGFSELLTSLVSDKKQQSYLDAIKTAGKSLLTIINDILDLAKIESGKMEIYKTHVNPYMIFSEIEQIFSMKIIEKKLEFFIDIDDRLPSTLILDETRLRQILLNLVGNAIKFTDEGYIKLKAKKEYRSEDQSSVDLIISIEDTGVGIHEEELGNIFDSFNQQHGQNSKKFGGTGLGLSICKKFLEIMNGQITVESELGVGSTFGIILKDVEVSSSEVSAFEKDDFIMDSISFNNAKILVVDDVESNRDLMKELLSMIDLNVITAENGEEAILIASEYQPDLILMDIRMPIMDGIEATRRISANPLTNNIPIIALTASSLPSEREVIFDVGMKAFLRKPIKIRNLIETLADFLESTPRDSAVVGDSTQDVINTNIVHYEDLLVDIQNEIVPLHDKLKSVIMISDVKKFIKVCRQIGEKYKVQPLLNLSDQLEEHSQSLNIEKMESLIKTFPGIMDLIQNYKEK